MTRLLSVIWYNVFPPQFGGQKGIAEFTQYLSRYLSTYVVCSANNKLTEQSFPGECTLPIHKRQFLQYQSYKLLDQVIVREKSTHLLIEHPYYGVIASLLASKHKIPLVVHSHNIESDRFRELGKWWWPFLYLLEKFTHRRAALSLFKTPDDRDRAINYFQLNPQKTMLVPFGLHRQKAPAEAERQVARRVLAERHGIPSHHKILLFNGTLDYAPNARALSHLVQDILPRLSASHQDFTLLVTGRNESPEFSYLWALQHDQLIQAGKVDDVELYFLGADLFLNPVDTGGGIKVKVMEALSNGLPVISYRSGARGIDPSVCGEQLTLLNDGDMEGFVQEISNQWNHTIDIPQVFFDTYNWTLIVKEVAEMLNTLQCND